MNRLGADLMLVCSNVATATHRLRRGLRPPAGAARRSGRRLRDPASPSRRWPGERTSTTIGARGGSSNGPTTRRSGSASTASTSCPAGTTRRRSRTSPATRSSSSSWRTPRALSMDVLSWSRHHRLFPGEGSWDLGAFVGHVAAAGYPGPLSLEVFNDTFRQTDTRRTAAHARRSLAWVADQAARWLERSSTARPSTRRGSSTALPRLTDAAPPSGIDFVELKAEDTGALEELFGQLSFGFRGRHRTQTRHAVVGRGRPGHPQRAARPRPAAAPGRDRVHGARGEGVPRPRPGAGRAAGVSPHLRHRGRARGGPFAGRHRDLPRRTERRVVGLGRGVRARRAGDRIADHRCRSSSTWCSRGRTSTRRFCSTPAFWDSPPHRRPRSPALADSSAAR